MAGHDRIDSASFYIVHGTKNINTYNLKTNPVYKRAGNLKTHQKLEKSHFNISTTT